MLKILALDKKQATVLSIFSFEIEVYHTLGTYTWDHV
jgi:hypothetical protein